MGITVDSGYCEQCGEKVRIERKTPSHWVHFILSVFTMGLWLLPWLLVSVEKKPWYCARCGKNLGGGSGGWGLFGAALSKDPRKIKDESVRCPNCKESNRPEAIKCKHCGYTKETDSTNTVHSNNQDIKAKHHTDEDFSVDSEVKKCPSCAEIIKLEAMKCRFCGELFSEDTVQQLIEEKKNDYLKRMREEEVRIQNEQLLLEQQKKEGLIIECEVCGEDVNKSDAIIRRSRYLCPECFKKDW